MAPDTVYAYGKEEKLPVRTGRDHDGARAERSASWIKLLLIAL